MENTTSGMRNDILRTERLKNLMTQSGWQDVRDIFQELYENALHSLQDKEDLEARLTMKVLENILGKIDDSINLGTVQTERFARKFKNVVRRE